MKDKSTLFAVMMFTIIILLFVFTSCTSKSGQRKQEKVVVIDEYPTNIYDDYYSYKVKRIDHGVVTKISTTIRYDTGDTIYYTF
jgi:hypothetical protein